MRSQIHHLLAEAAGACADAPALTYKDTTLTYAGLLAEVYRFAAGFTGLGLARGERTAVYLEKRLETVAAVFGTSAAGGVFVPVNPLLRPRQVVHILADCDARILVTTAERLALLRAELEDCKSLDHVVIVGAPTSLAETSNPDAYDTAGYNVSWWPACDAAPEAILPVADGENRVVHGDVIDTDMAAILYTSGSTGRPKGVVLSHRNLIVGAESVSHYLGNTADDVILSVLPLSFDAGFSQLTTAFSVAAHVILLNYLLPGDLVRLCARHRVTGLTCVPPLWIQMAGETWPVAATQHLRYFASTGGRMPRSTLDRLRDIFPTAKPFLMYGLTEAFRSTYLDPAEVARRPDSIGKAIPNAEILVVRPDGTLCDPGEEGELVHRGALVALGYWNDPERTAKRFRPAPVRETGLCTPEIAVWSGDAVVRDEEGFLYFVGRKDDMIKTSGYRVSPTEIEEVAYDTGMVRDAVALGVDDAHLGQRVVLVVSPAGETFDTGALLAEMRKALPLYMVPHRIDVRREILRSPNGKFDRTLLRQELGA